LSYRPYATLSRRAAAMWRAYAAELEIAAGLTGTADLGLEHDGGVKFFHSDEEARAYSRMLQGQFDGDLPAPGAYAIWDRARTERAFPAIGPTVVGAAYCSLDGAVSPLRFYAALAAACARLGAVVHAGASVRSIERSGAGYRIVSARAAYQADRIVVAAGLGNSQIAAALGVRIPLTPVRGQILVSRRMPRMLPLPTHIIRQTDDGSIIIGDSKEQAGLDDGSSLGVMGDIAARAVATFPALARTSVIRSWSGLRILTQDGAPIYHAPAGCAGIYFLNVHSGVTLAPIHSTEIVSWVLGDGPAPGATAFSADRFHAQAA